jgi:hypothetical protein
LYSQQPRDAEAIMYARTFIMTILMIAGILLMASMVAGGG